MKKCIEVIIFFLVIIIESYQITLRSLVMEDLHLSQSQSGHHILMKSENMPPKASSSQSSNNMSFAGIGSAPLDVSNEAWTFSPANVPYISSSCPEMRSSAHHKLYSSSLPDKLEMEKPFYKALKKSNVTQRKTDMPGTFLTLKKTRCPQWEPLVVHKGTLF